MPPDSIRRVKTLLIISSLFLGLTLFGQNQTELRFGSITTEDGLSHSTVNSITQDSFGFLWIATMDGLNRYDGNLIEVFKHEKDNPKSLNDNTVWKVLTTSDNEIWLGTSKGICKYDYQSGEFTHIPLQDSILISNPTRELMEGDDGSIWAITTIEGLIKIQRNNTKRYKVEFHNDLLKGIENNYSGRGLTNDDTRDDIIWMTQAFNIAGLNTSTLEMTYLGELFDSLGYERGFFTGVTVDDEGVLWVVSSDLGMFRVNVDERTIKSYKPSQNPNSIASFDLFKTIQDRNDNLWISSLGSGLSVLRNRNGDQFDVYKMDPSKSNSLLNDNIVDLYEDRDGVIWIGTHGGGLQYFTQEADPFALHTYVKGNGYSIPSNNISSVFEDSRDNTWIGTRSEGFVKAKLRDNKAEIDVLEVFNTQNPKSKYIKKNIAISFYEDEEIGLMIGMRLGGIQVYDYNNENFRSYFYQPGDLDLIAEYHVNVVEEMLNGDLLLGTYNGLFLWHRKERYLSEFNEAHDRLKTLKGRYITFLKNEKNKLWIGTGQYGVQIWDKEDEELISFAEKYLRDTSISFESILSFYEDSDNNYWIGSWDGGLLKFNTSTEEIHIYNESHGLNNSVIYSIQGDETGSIWVSTNKGISKFDPESERFFNFNKSDGLQGEEYNSRVGFANPKTGHIFFGGMEGLNAFLPSNIETDLKHPLLYINKLTTYEESEDIDVEKTVTVKKGDRITINHKCYLMSFVIGAPKLPQNDNIKYAYKLEGLSDNWINLGNTQEFTLTNLASGQYTLKLRSTLENGSMSEEEAMLSIVSLPPWWHTWWAYICYGLLSAAALYSIYKYRIRQLTKYQSLRTQISSDLHDDVGTILSTIAFQAEIMELEQKKSEIEGFGKLTKLSRLAMGRMRDTVWAMDARRDNTDSLLARMNDFLFDAFDHQEIEYKFDHSRVKKGASIAPNIRQTIYLVFKESVTNALKHSTGTMIDISLMFDGKNFALEVHDNGRVDPAQMKTSGLGLSNMKARAEKVDASFSVDTAKGFTVKLEKKNQ